MLDTFINFILMLKQLPASTVASKALLLAASNVKASHWKSSWSEAERITTDRPG
jgi:hypothetical protein